MITHDPTVTQEPDGSTRYECSCGLVRVIDAEGKAHKEGESADPAYYHVWGGGGLSWGAVRGASMNYDKLAEAIEKHGV